MWDIKTDEQVIALTFDDGPHNKYTPEILDVLSKYDAKATFFIVKENAEKIRSLLYVYTTKIMNLPFIRIHIPLKQMFLI